MWDSVKAAHPEHKLWELGKVIGQMWREISDVEKQVFIDEHDVEKVIQKKWIFILEVNGLFD